MLGRITASFGGLGARAATRAWANPPAVARAWAVTQGQAPVAWGAAWRRSLFIQTVETPNKDALKFVPTDEKVMEAGSHEFNNMSQAYCSPLAKTLFRIEGVKSVFFGPDFISVNKEEDADWDMMKPFVFSAIMEFYASGEELFTGEQAPQDTAVHEDDDEVVVQIKEMLETRVRPAVQDDGGDIEYKGFVDGVVLVQLKGACKGCSSSSVTLKLGIEKMLMYYIPEVTAVMAVEDDDVRTSLCQRMSCTADQIPSSLPLSLSIAFALALALSASSLPLSLSLSSLSSPPSMWCFAFCS